MQIGLIGLDRRGGNIVRQLRYDHKAVVYDLDEGVVEALAAEGRRSSDSTVSGAAGFTASMGSEES
jgi:6-phosphogluconate dehydrogenase (decarboxylating)